MTFTNNIKAVFDAPAGERTRDSAELVSTIIMIAGFAVMSLLAVNWLGTAVMKKAADVSTCIEGSNSYTSANAAGNATNNDTNCKTGSGGLKSFKSDSSYTGRK